MAYRDGEAVGRVAAIVNRKANEQWNHKEVRFGWFDFIDDREVSSALMEKVYEFGREHGMDTVVGPLGFTDFDPEGMLVDGFDQMSTMPLIYNHPYYVDHMDSMGFEKDADWVELRITVPSVLPPKLERLYPIIEQRTSVHIRPINRKIVREENYGRKVFNLINECYKDLYDFTILPDDMADKYLGFYLSILDLDYLSMAENEKGELVAFAITMPGLIKALQKSRGRLFPFGWWHILKSMYWKHEDTAELLLIGVRPDYQNSGINALVLADCFRKFNKFKVKYAETNAILETNTANLAQMGMFEHIMKKRRRSYKKAIEK